MDPLSALSLAATIFQVISFSHEVINTAKQIRESGHIDRFEELEKIGLDIQAASACLKTRLAVPKGEDPEEEEDKVTTESLSKNL